MNISTSECSSGCESGWTTYLDQVSNSTDPYGRSFQTNYHQGSKGGNYHDLEEEEEEEEQEDESMVSDASSGPPHFHEYYDYDQNRAFDHAHYNYGSGLYEDKRKSKNKSKTKEPIRAKTQHNLCLDDTASSPVYHLSQDNVPSDSGKYKSVEHVEGESRTKKHLGFFKSSSKGKSSGSLLGRKRY